MYKPKLYELSKDLGPESSRDVKPNQRFRDEFPHGVPIVHTKHIEREGSPYDSLVHVLSMQAACRGMNVSEMTGWREEYLCTPLMDRPKRHKLLKKMYHAGLTMHECHRYVGGELRYVTGLLLSGVRRGGSHTAKSAKFWADLDEVFNEDPNKAVAQAKGQMRQKVWRIEHLQQKKPELIRKAALRRVTGWTAHDVIKKAEEEVLHYFTYSRVYQWARDPERIRQTRERFNITDAEMHMGGVE